MTVSYLFDPMDPFGVPVSGDDQLFPVRRIFCVGRNYEEHAREMGNEVDRDAPFYFTKSVAHAVLSGAKVTFPKGTANYHHEMEFAVYLGEAGKVFGYGCALDMTRRDRQQDGKDKRRPWSLGKDVENSAVLAPITKAGTFGDIAEQDIWLDVDGVRKQQAVLSDMIHSVPEIIAHLSGYYELGAGDVILTGTPAGVGPVTTGQVVSGGVTGLVGIDLTLTAGPS